MNGAGPSTHLEVVMGTVVGFSSPDPLPPDAVVAAVAKLHEADRVFSTWKADSPLSKLRTGTATASELDRRDVALIDEVLERCRQARELTDGAFDPWAMPGGVDPTGLVKGWAAQRALDALTERGVSTVMVNAGGDIAVAGAPGGRAWRVAIRHPGQPEDFAAVIEVGGCVATSGDYERPGELIDPATGRPATVASSATVTGPRLDLVDALATGLAVAGRSLLPAIDRLPGFEAYLITESGERYATPGMIFAAP
jgi:thiamine biosynthesis lipoprotein